MPARPFGPVPPPRRSPLPPTPRSTHRPAAYFGRLPRPRPSDPSGEIVRWGAFCCLLVPVVLIAYGWPVGGAAATALGLAAVIAACRALLRHSVRTAAARGARSGPSAPGRRAPASRTVPGARRGARRGPGRPPGR